MFYCTVQTCPVTAAVVSSIVVFVFTSLIFLTIGIFIGYFVQKHKFTANLKSSSFLDKRAHSTPPRVPHDQPTAPTPEYTPIHAKGTLVEEHVQGFGMKKCEAYALSSQSTVNTTVTLGGQSTASRPEEHAYSPVQVSSNNYVSFHK